MTNPGGFPSRFKRPEDSPGFLLWQVTNSWQRRIRRALKGVGLTHVQFVLLTATDWLSDAKLPTTQSNVARFAHTDVMMTSQVTRTLEGKGLVVVEENPSDARAHTLRVTPAGKKLVRAALELVEDADGEFFGPLARDSARFVETLNLLIRSEAQRGDASS
ncbi:MAG TPA: MarR family winged helix-turn-helix transcriptional regulator [Nitrososphaerales archaeon]|nr:MarR family winged helix-turn-helix transcriptional regulator [Nitrososphaerales archaeon]